MMTSKLIYSISAMALFLGFAIQAPAQTGGAAMPPAAQSPAASQGTHGGAGAMDPDTPEMDSTLNLTDEQKEKIKTIRDDAKDQMKAMKKDTTLTDEQRQQKTKQLRMDTRKQIWAVMTPEQQKQWAQEMRERRQSKHAGDAPATTPQ
jgi:periplasmic protein CpxP/Spy